MPGRARGFSCVVTLAYLSAREKFREREYCEKLRRDGTERILLTGISYDTDKKTHRCRIHSDY